MDGLDPGLDPGRGPGLDPGRGPGLDPGLDLALEGEALAVLGEGPLTKRRLSHSRVTRGVWRVSAPSGSAIAKVLARPEPAGPDAADPSSIRFWLREPLLYAAGTPPPYLAAGIRLPRLLDRFDRSDGDVAIWLEDVEGVPAGEWELAGFATAGRRLGRAQGAYLAGEPLPEEPWLSRGYLRSYLAEKDAGPGARLLQRDDAWREPRIGRHFPPTLRDGLRRLRAERDLFLGWLAAVPVTFAHLDVWPDNLFDGGAETILIDWGFAGLGAAGEDIGNLVPDSVFDLRHPPSIMGELDGTLFEAYRAGVRDAGWRGDERLLRLGVCASAVKYDWIAGATLARARSGEAQRIYGQVPVDDDALFGTRAAVLAFLLDWATEARQLAAALRLA